MSLHGLLRTDEPPDGDYVRYIESLVGRPPEDAERAAREHARRLEQADSSAGWPGIERGPRTRPEHGARPPAAGGTMRVGQGATRAPPALRQAFSRVLVVIGALLVALGLIAPEAIAMTPGILLLVAGLAIGRNAGRRAVRASRDTAS